MPETLIKPDSNAGYQLTEQDIQKVIDYLEAQHVRSGKGMGGMQKHKLRESINSNPMAQQQAFELLKKLSRMEQVDRERIRANRIAEQREEEL